MDPYEQSAQASLYPSFSSNAFQQLSHAPSPVLRGSALLHLTKKTGTAAGVDADEPYVCTKDYLKGLPNTLSNSRKIMHLKRFDYIIS